MASTVSILAMLVTMTTQMKKMKISRIGVLSSNTGFGNAVNVHFTVQEVIRTGVAGLQIEDQEAPKKSGTGAGRRCISIDEAVGKYRAAVAARDEGEPLGRGAEPELVDRALEPVGPEGMVHEGIDGEGVFGPLGLEGEHGRRVRFMTSDKGAG